MSERVPRSAWLGDRGVGLHSEWTVNLYVDGQRLTSAVVRRRQQWFPQPLLNHNVVRQNAHAIASDAVTQNTKRA